MALFKSVLIAWICLQQSVAMWTENEIKDKIFSGYKTQHRPARDINVNVSCGVLSIHDLNMKKRLLSASLWFSFEWEDWRLSWNLTDGDSDNIFVSPDTIWKPSINVMNSVNGMSPLRDGRDVLINSRGIVSWYIAQSLDTQCPVHIRRFPFDKQQCHIKFEIWLDRRIRFGTSKVFQSGYEENSELSLGPVAINFVQKTSTFRAHNDLSIVLERRSLFYVLNILLPMILLFFLNSFVLLLPSGSGEKIGVSVSILLSFQLFLSVIGDSLPKNSLTISFFSLYVTLAIINSVIIVIVSILLLVNVTSCYAPISK